MKDPLLKLLPKNRKDTYTYCLIAVAFLPLIYLMFGRIISYLTLNIILLLIFCVIFIMKITHMVIYKEKTDKFHSLAVIFMIAMFVWIFISSFFAFNKEVTWLGVNDGWHCEDSVWQYMFYFAVAIIALNMKRENIKYIMSVFITVACIVIVIQFQKGDYNYGFINRNHTGYYLCMTSMLAAGMFMFSKKWLSTCLLFIAIGLHFASLTLNGSFGPVIGLLAYFLIGVIYLIIHKRHLIVKFNIVFLSFVMIFAIFDYVPKVKDLKTEPETTIEKVVGLSVVVLNKLGIISQESYENIELAPGSDGYSRWRMWGRSLENIKEMPLFGTGVGGWKLYNPDMPNPKPHNEFLQYAATAGIPTLLAYLALILYIFIKYRKTHKDSTKICFIVMGALFVYLVQSIFGNVMPFTAPLFFILIGIVIKELDFKENDLPVDEKQNEHIEDLIENEKNS